MIARFLSKYLFWVLQFLGWGSGAFIIVFAGGYDPNPTKAMALFLPMMVFGILSSSLLRWILKTKVAKYEWGVKKLFAIILANILCALLLFLLVLVAGIIKGFTEANEKTDNIAALDSIFLPVIAGIGGVAVFLFIWTIFYYGTKYLITYNKTRVSRLQLKEAVKSAQLKTLKGHIHPQYLATSLKNIKGLMPVNISEARGMLTALSELLRYSLTKNDETPVSIADELEMVQKYSQIQAIDAAAYFSIDTKVSNELLSHMIPPMILLNLIILGSKYGIINSSLEEKINIGIVEFNSSICITISFNGKLKQEAETKAIENSLKQRLFLLHGKASNYAMSFSDNMTSVEITIPSRVNLELNAEYAIN